MQHAPENPDAGYVVGAASAEPTLATAAARGALDIGPSTPRGAAGCCRPSSKIPLAHDSSEAEEDTPVPIFMSISMFVSAFAFSLFGVSDVAWLPGELGGSLVGAGGDVNKLYIDLP